MSDPPKTWPIFTDLTPEYEAYYSALGKFVASFAEIENNLVQLLSRYLNLDADSSKAIFSGLRIDAARQYILRLKAFGKLPANADKHLDRAFEQLAKITTLRNDILHYGVSVNERAAEAPYFQVSNSARTTAEAARVTPVSAAILTGATTDLANIGFVLSWAHPHREDAGSPELTRIWASYFEDRLRFAWRYIPPPQVHPNATAAQTVHKRSRKPSRQPKS